MLDSLVRVSRREKENHFVSILLSHQQATKINSFSAFLDITVNIDKAEHSALSASKWGSMIMLALVSFASFSAISGTL
jgi:hypothetical protein